MNTNETKAPADNKSLTIGVLSVTAVLLFAALMIVQSVSTPQAMAFAQTAESGDYLVATGQFQTSHELVYVLDAAVERLIAYGYDYNQKRIRVVDTFDLRRLKATKQTSGRP
jgi:hypothetical protein